MAEEEAPLDERSRCRMHTLMLKRRNLWFRVWYRRIWFHNT